VDKVEMSNLCVSGDTKIEVRITTAKEVDGNTTNTYRLPPLEIEIQQLEEFIQEGLPLDYIEVLSRDIDTGNQEIDYHQITAFAQTSPKAKVMKITDEESGKSIVVTPDHKVYTKNRGYVMAKHLKETDILDII
jgi:intein/homing endonuclease